MTDKQAEKLVLSLAYAQMLSEEVEEMYYDGYFRQAAKQAAKNTTKLLRDTLNHRYTRKDGVDGIPLIEYGNSNEELAAMRATIAKAFVFDYNLKKLSSEDYAAFTEEQEELLQKYNLLQAIP